MTRSFPQRAPVELDTLPTFGDLITDDDREQKARHADYGKYFKIYTPDAFADNTWPQRLLEDSSSSSTYNDYYQTPPVVLPTQTPHMWYPSHDVAQYNDQQKNYGLHVSIPDQPLYAPYHAYTTTTEPACYAPTIWASPAYGSTPRSGSVLEEMFGMGPYSYGPQDERKGQ